MERDKYASIIHDELNKLGVEFGRYKERWDKLSRSIETVNKDIENIHVTTDKISKRFDSISKVELGDKKEIEYVERNLNNLIFIPTKSSNRTLVDIDKIPQESYPLFIELLDSIRSGILKNYKRFTSDNSNFEDLVLAEVRYNDARVLFERIGKNEYVIISMFIKKCRNNLGYKNTLYSAISAYKMVKDKLIELSSDPNFLQAQDETTNEIYNILNKNNKNEKKLKKV